MGTGAGRARWPLRQKGQARQARLRLLGSDRLPRLRLRRGRRDQERTLRSIIIAPALLVGVAGVKRIAHPFQHLVVEAKPPEQSGELRFQRFLANVFAAAGSRVKLIRYFMSLRSKFPTRRNREVQGEQGINSAFKGGSGN